jgi:hypothetical protein
MQTFLPLATTNYSDVAKTLDNKRLNKQALEGWQILMNLLELDPSGEFRRSKGWSNHPAVKMWVGSELELYKYVLAMVDEWKSRGFKSTIGDKATGTIVVAHENALLDETAPTPDWMNDTDYFESVASSHRQALLVKDYAWYSQFNWPEDTGVEPTEYNYVWPSERQHV